MTPITDYNMSKCAYITGFSATMFLFPSTATSIWTVSIWSSPHRAAHVHYNAFGSSWRQGQIHTDKQEFLLAVLLQ